MGDGVEAGQAASGSKGVVIVGASLGGLRCAEALRGRGYSGRITLIGAEAALPYDRPPLSKQVLSGARDFGDLLLCSDEALAALMLDLRLGVRATELDAAGAVVHCSDGRRVAYDHLVLATGSTPRRLPGFDRPGVHYLRSWQDAVALRADFEAGKRVAVIGGGFIGGEVASSARSLGLEVTLIEGAEAPLAPVLGPDIGAVMVQLYRDKGVDLRCGQSVASLIGDDAAAGLRLSDGSEIAAETVVVGIGATPTVDYLAGSGLPLDNGILCTSDCRVQGHSNIFALGDVARFDHPHYGALRIEHWTNVVEQAQIVAANIVAEGPAAVASGVPYFWSDQFGVKIQFVGRRYPDSRFTLVEGSLDTHKFIAAYERDGKVTGVVCFNQPRAVLNWRRSFERDIAAQMIGAPADGRSGANVENV